MNTEGAAIPLIFHQTWKSETPPHQWRFAVDSWRTHHPEWAFMWWTDESNRAFVRDTFPDFLSTYDRFSYGIQRADAVRYLLLYHFGGVYADLDIECLSPVVPLLSPGCFIAAREPQKHIQNAGRRVPLSGRMAVRRISGWGSVDWNW
jgi:inositol phosphorylceramide mannosyltransferase catalytic subunit